MSVSQNAPLVKRGAEWLCRHELIFLGIVTLLLLYPTRWAPLFFLPVPLIWVCRRVARGRFSRPTPLDGALLLILLTALVGFLVSVDRWMSWTRFWYILLGLALYYGLVNGVQTERGIRRVGDLLVVGGLGVALLTMVGTDWSQVRLLEWDIYRFLPPLIRHPSWGGVLVGRGSPFNPRAISMGLAMLLPVALSQALYGEGRGRRCLSAVVALVMGGVLLLTQSLQAVLGLAVALLILLVWRSRWFLLLIPVGGLLAGIALSAYGWERAAVSLLSVDHPLGVAVVLRLDMWNRALDMLRAMPFTGIGLDTFSLIQAQFFPGMLLGTELHAHNLLLQVALDLGVPGLLASFWLLVAFAWAVVGAGSRCTNRALLRGCAAGVGAYLGAGLIDAPWSTKSGLALWVLLGVAMASVQRLKGDQGPAARRLRWAPLVGIPLVVVLSLPLAPGLRALNRGSLRAHRTVLEAQAGEEIDVERAARAIVSLEQALAYGLADGQACRTLGRLYGWLGDEEQALAMWEQGVRLDGEAPLARYAPWLDWLRSLQGEEGGAGWRDLVGVYAQWRNRYPARAEHYVQSALVWERHLGDPVRARQVLEAGRANDARPAGVLDADLFQR